MVCGQPKSKPKTPGPRNLPQPNHVDENPTQISPSPPFPHLKFPFAPTPRPNALLNVSLQYPLPMLIYAYSLKCSDQVCEIPPLEVREIHHRRIPQTCKCALFVAVEIPPMYDLTHIHRICRPRGGIPQTKNKSENNFSHPD